MTNNNVELFFEKISKKYSENFNYKKSSKTYIFLKRRNLVLKNLNSKKNGKFLDIGTGTGDITSSIINNNNFKKSILVDISKSMLQKCKKKIKKNNNISFLNTDLTLYKTKLKFNYILCLGVLAHYPNTTSLISKLSSLSKKNATVIVQSSLLNFITIKLNKFFFSKRYKKNFDYDIKYVYENNLEKLFKKNGFKILKVYRYSLAIPILDKIFPKFNYYLDYYFDFFFKNVGAEAIFVLKKK